MLNNIICFCRHRLCKQHIYENYATVELFNYQRAKPFAIPNAKIVKLRGLVYVQCFSVKVMAKISEK
jgi:hypothetical protein